MCGILGIARLDGGLVETRQFAGALHRLRHRGPDDEGYLLFDHRNGGVQSAAGRDTVPGLDLPGLANVPAERWSTALGHRRLSIIDLSSAGHQPMASSCGRYWVTYNGEIYNYLELRAELERNGYPFRTRSDTEVVLAAYVAWGADMLSRLVGMYALCILDTRARRMFLARDPFGIKPLYFVRDSDVFAFASEIKGLEALGLVEATANVDALYEYLRFGERTAGTQTMFANVHALPAAHSMTVDLRGGAISEPPAYATLSAANGHACDFAEAVAEVRAAFDDSVRLHLRSDVPVGSCLSGGLDSTAIIMLAQRHLEGAQLHAFSFVTDDAALNEEPFVDLVSGVVVHKTRPGAEDLRRDLPRLMEAHDLPFGSSSIYAQFRVMELARESGMKVMLDGQGADEIFGGYLSLTGARVTSLLRSGQLGDARRLLSSLPRNARPLFSRVALGAAGRMLPDRWRPIARRLVGEGAMPPWLNRRWFGAHGLHFAQPLYGSGADVLKSEMLLAISQTSLPQLLRYEDSNSMYFSIESRVPYCEWRLAQLALSMPEEYLISAAGSTKSVLREAMRGLVPERILRRDKIGFQTPEGKWFASLRPWLTELTASDSFLRLPFFDSAKARALLLDEQVASTFWNPYLWRIVNVALWADRHQISFESAGCGRAAG
jgi:asparagine synthase (glutamine-hydrolysing)